MSSLSKDRFRWRWLTIWQLEQKSLSVVRLVGCICLVNFDLWIQLVGIIYFSSFVVGVVKENMSSAWFFWSLIIHKEVLPNGIVYFNNPDVMVGYDFTKLGHDRHIGRVDMSFIARQISPEYPHIIRWTIGWGAVIIWQRSSEVNPSVLVGSYYLIGIFSYGPFSQ